MIKLFKRCVCVEIFQRGSTVLIYLHYQTDGGLGSTIGETVEELVVRFKILLSFK